MTFEHARQSFGAFFVFLAIAAVVCSGVNAQDKPTVTSKEADYGKKVQEGTDVAAKMKIAEKFLKEFPKSELRKQFALYLSGVVTGITDPAQRATHLETYLRLFNQESEADLVAPSRIEMLATQKKHDEMFTLAESYLARRSGDLRTRLFLAVEASNVMRGGNGKFAQVGLTIASKGIELIEAGTKPAETTDDDWKLAQSQWHGQFYSTLGFINSSLGKRPESLVNFERATQLTPSDVSSWVMLGYAYNLNYQQIAREYAISEGAKRAELRKQAETELDKVIEIYARVVAMTDGDAASANLNREVRGDLVQYYKFRHGGSETGLAELIAKYKK